MKPTKKDRTRREIMEAAKDIIREKGHDALTVRYLAQVTGYSYTNLYYYFRDLPAFLWALRMDMIEDMIRELSVDSETVPDEEFSQSLCVYADYFFRHPNLFRFFYFYPFVPPEGDESQQGLEERFRSIWQNAFAGLLREGILQPNEIEPVTKTIIYALQGFILLHISAGEPINGDWREELHQIINQILKRD